MARLWSDFSRGILKQNAVFRLLLGMCPALAVTTTALNGVGMGLATTVVLVMSNTIVSLLRNYIPERIRIPCFIVIIASFVTMVDLLMAAHLPGLHGALGIFVPLIVVNCLILGRAEAFAFRSRTGRAVSDGLGMGIGFILALTALGGVREIFGLGTLFGRQVLGASFRPAIVMILPPGAFLTLGLMLGLLNWWDGRAKRMRGRGEARG